MLRVFCLQPGWVAAAARTMGSSGVHTSWSACAQDKFHWHRVNLPLHMHDATAHLLRMWLDSKQERYVCHRSVWQVGRGGEGAL